MIGLLVSQIGIECVKISGRALHGLVQSTIFAIRCKNKGCMDWIFVVWRITVGLQAAVHSMFRSSTMAGLIVNFKCMM